MDFSSKLLESAVQEIAQLPGIGKRTALRLALHLLKQPVEHTQSLASALTFLREGVIFCSCCHNLSDTPTCEICASPKRNKNLLCVVEDIRDVMAIENTGQYNGLYHVLGGIISPMDGIGPQDLTINSLIDKVRDTFQKSFPLIPINHDDEIKGNIFHVGRVVGCYNRFGFVDITATTSVIECDL